MSSAEKLCLACGLCCDGSLFDNVRVLSGDDAARLKEQGLPLRGSRGKVPVRFFRQPCAALGKDCRCGVYSDRPQQCRAFECLVLKEAMAGVRSWASARQRVGKARREADALRAKLQELGEGDERRSLSERFRRVLKHIEAGDTGLAEQFADLGLAMHRFQLKVHAQFHTRPSADGEGARAKAGEGQSSSRKPSS